MKTYSVTKSEKVDSDNVWYVQYVVHQHQDGKGSVVVCECGTEEMANKVATALSVSDALVPELSWSK